MSSGIRLTQYSHGAGCGCKIAPAVLEKIVAFQGVQPQFPSLIVGNTSKDDAAVVDLGDGTGVISTTDFFMPIVDDPFDFGRIAATNAMSDIYAMGGTPLMAIAILGWPINTLPAEIANQVIEGGRQVCHEAGIALAGGHSIDAPEPIFGLAVTGRVALKQLKRNDQAQVGDKLYLTKALGVGIVSTAQKRACLRDEDSHVARDLMCQLNSIGAELSQLEGITAMTDVTGFGLLGHLIEMCEGSQVCARLWMDKVPMLPQVPYYLSQGCVPGGSDRNFASYGDKVSPLSDFQRQLLCDPQTSGGLLIAVTDDGAQALEHKLKAADLPCQQIGQLIATEGQNHWVTVC